MTRASPSSSHPQQGLIIFVYKLIKNIYLKAYFVPITLLSACESTGAELPGKKPCSSVRVGLYGSCLSGGRPLVCLRVRAERGDLQQRRLHVCLRVGLPR